jgi:hypothetical protein
MGVLSRFVLISALAKRYFVNQDFFGHYLKKQDCTLCLMRSSLGHSQQDVKIDRSLFRG